MIGEDGRMTERGRRAVRRPDRRRGAGRRSSRRCARRGAIRGEEPYTHSVPFSHRSGERIEPLISLQWFCRMDELAAPAIEVVERDEVRITPEQWKRVYLDWMRNIRPWCISRQLWWGHRIPVWYCDACEETYVAEQAPERCGACGGELRQEEDVLDTWFSSALWPFATLGWPDETPELRAFYPTDFLTTAREILFLWVARMIMTGLEFAGDVPFRDVYVHSVIQARDGRRMSKSLGTGIDPLEEIDVHGADALRFGLLAMSSTQDVRYSDAKVQQGRDLANKMWNASRLILLGAAEVEPAPQPQGAGGPLDPLAAAAGGRGGHRRPRALRLRPRGARALPLLLVRALRLVPGDRQAAALREETGGEREPALRARRGADAGPPDDAVRHRGDLELITRRARATSSCRPYPEADASLVDEAAEAEVEEAIELTRRLRAWRDLVEVPVGSRLPARRRRSAAPEFVERLARFDVSARRRLADPIAVDRPACRCCAGESIDAAAVARADRRAPGGARLRGRARRGASSPTRASSPRRRRRSSRRSARSWSATAPSSRSWSAELERRRGRGLPRLARADRLEARASSGCTG